MGKAALSLSGADRDQVAGAGCQCCLSSSVGGCDGGVCVGGVGLALCGSCLVLGCRSSVVE